MNYKSKVQKLRGESNIKVSIVVGFTNFTLAFFFLLHQNLASGIQSKKYF